LASLRYAKISVIRSFLCEIKIKFELNIEMSEDCRRGGAIFAGHWGGRAAIGGRGAPPGPSGGRAEVA
jgi:hypothetical protein